MVYPVAQAPRDGPEPVHGNHYQRKHGRERHAVVEKDPHSAHKLSERPVAEHVLDRVETHRRHGHGDVRHGQVDDVVVEHGAQTSLTCHGDEDEAVAEHRDDYDEVEHHAQHDLGPRNRRGRRARRGVQRSSCSPIG